ncbi:MAG: hypothetical protein N4A33_04250 [Bacteriovoracaceae bacterium]|jgi:hypothetical protein|nr:hypothetical protein [Bacteriovoracaceae bacterium]
MQNSDYEYPKEMYIELIGLSPDFKGRVTIYKNLKAYDAHIDIVTAQSSKIFNHVGRVYSQPSEKEAFDLSYMKLKIYLKAKS